MASAETDEFLKSPSDCLLNLLSKDQLIEVATHYNVGLTAYDKRLKESI